MLASGSNPMPQEMPLCAARFAGFAPLAAQLAALDAQLAEAEAGGQPAIATKAQQLRARIRAFEPSVTMIGQVKAGKTTLVNALTGTDGLLPADVNPWTSVVTSLHLQTGSQRKTETASFTFFTEEEWTHLVQRGGRIGELANRAGADDELDKVRRQLEQMREKSRERLGRRFELLLGQSHDYDSYDPALIERYVCLGDDFWEEASGDRDKGRFADITKTADLWMRDPDLPLNLCVRDTPGVNDTFMIREQITINALRGSKLCVVVLAATQALTSVDLALIRMISNVKSRELIIFVNRIDELADPASEIPEIEASIRDTLRKHDGPKDADILFGCGFWAAQAMAGRIDELSLGSAEALLNFAEASVSEASTFATTEEMVWDLSGLGPLSASIARRIEEGAGAQLIHEIEVALRNLGQSADVAAQAGEIGGCRMTPDALGAGMDVILNTARGRLRQDMEPLRKAFSERAEASRQTFVARATSALVKHMEAQGSVDVWTYDPCGLRVLLRSAFQRHVRAVSKLGQEVMSDAARDIGTLYTQAFELRGQTPMLEPSPLPSAEPPVVLGQTIALDLRSSWWTRFWRRRKGYQALTEDFTRLILEETQPMLDALIADNGAGFEARVDAALEDFVSSNRTIMVDIARSAPEAPPLEPASPVRPVRPVRPAQPARTARPRPQAMEAIR